jgi:hypothetical protein
MHRPQHREKGDGAPIGCAWGRGEEEERNVPEDGLPVRGGQIMILVVDGVQRGPRQHGKPQAVAAGKL